MNRLLYPFASGKNSKFAYFVRAALRDLVPDAWCRRRLRPLIESIGHHPDRDDILARAAYCNRLDGPARLSSDAPRLADFRMGFCRQVYYLDARECVRYFPKDLRWRFLDGDVTEVPAEPTIVKSRPVAGDNANSVLLPLNKVRHFLFVRDRTPFSAKRDIAVFRGKVHANPKRRALFRSLFGSPLCDLGDTSGNRENPPEWKRGKLTIREQLESKFVFAIEGNDVASNLKWVLSSNSLALMPRPEYETWFLEGTLRPGVHYVEIAPDASDAEEKIRWYSSHPDTVERILAAAHAHVARFQDPRRERLVALLVLARYFGIPGEENLP